MNTVIDKDESGVSVLKVSSSADVGNKRKKKFTGGNASKRHRDRVNIEFNNLAQLLPFPENVIAKLDKSSILRLAVSYIRAKSFFKDTIHTVDEELRTSKPSIRKKCIEEGTGIVSEIFSSALDGFLLVLTEDMKVLFVSESVRDYLGYCQAGIIHENFLQFVNPSDHTIIQSNIMYKKDEVEGKRDNGLDNTDFNSRHTFSNGQIVHGIDQRDRKQGVVHRRFVCRMKCAFSCSSRFYTAYRTFQYSGHLRRSTIQEGREEKHLNTLVIFATPTTNTASNQSMDIIPDLEENTTNQIASPTHMERPEYTPYEQRYSSGFRIEPTLRPHIAPIPVSTSEATADHRSPPHAKQRQLPLLIPVAEVYSKDSYTQNIPNYIPRMYATPNPSESRAYVPTNSSDSRYSDYSDDSKCSPASSPNLIWKRRPNSPQLIPAFNARPDLYKSVRHNGNNNSERCRQPSLSESDYHILRQRNSPEFRANELFAINRSPPVSNVDVYLGASMLMNLRKHGLSPPHSVSLLETAEGETSRKRYLDDRVQDELITRSPPKRFKSPPTSRAFHISSLLGLEDEHNERREVTNKDEDIDVCRVDNERNEKRIFYDDIFYKMSKNLDFTFHKTMSAHPWHS